MIAPRLANPARRGLCAGVWLVSLTLWAAPLRAQEPSPLPQPAPEAPAEIAWSYGEWWTVLGSGFFGGAAGSVGAVALYWQLAGVCSPGQDAGRCLDANFPSSYSVGLLGLVLGAGTGALTAGSLLGYEGSPLWTYGGAALGLLGVGLPFGGYASAQFETKSLLWVGAGISLLTVPLLSALYFYITQPNSAPIGGAAAASPSPGTWGVLPPRAEPGARGVIWWGPALHGAF